MWVGLGLCILTVTAVGLSAYGAHRWTLRMHTLAGRLEAAQAQGRQVRPSHFNARELDGLPAPVRRYLGAVLKDGQAVIKAARVELTGTFRLSATAEWWRHFTSHQSVTVRRPGFIWDANISVLPGLPVRVVDGYIAGEGLLHATLFGFFTVANAEGSGDEMARGELMRFLAEAPWYPTAFLPSQGVRWEAVDDLSANATLSDGPVTVTLLFRFTDAGLIDSAHAQARGAKVGKTTVMLPWEGCWSHYEVREGMKVPTRGEAAWLRPEGRMPYFNGIVTSLAYEFAA